MDYARYDDRSREQLEDEMAGDADPFTELAMAAVFLSTAKSGIWLGVLIAG